MNNSSPTIPAPKNCLFGVAINSDGSIENVGIGSFDVDRAEQLAAHLELLAAAIRAKAPGAFLSAK